MSSTLFSSTTPAPDDPAPKRAVEHWLHAWHDSMASIRCFSPCIRTGDLNNDGEHRLIIADMDKKLKIYKGTSLVSEHALLDIPSALCLFYPDLQKPQLPSLAVAAGSHIFIYRNLRPYYKFTLPSVDIESEEKDAWDDARAGKVDPSATIARLLDMKERGLGLSLKSTQLLELEGEEQTTFYNTQKLLPVVQMTVATCMETLPKNMTNDKAVSSLVIGTESKHVIIMEPSGTSVLKKFQLPSVPVFIAVNGTYDVEYRIIVACRNGNVYQIKKGKLLGTVIELETQAVGLVCLDKSFLVGCMDQAVHSFHFKGKKNFSIYLSEPITNMELLHLKRIKNQKALLVALSSGEVRVYNKKHLVSSFKSDDIITGMRFGPYGREDSSLILAHKSGALTFKILSRHADLEVGSRPAGPPPEQDIPLNVPKKTKLYVEQTQRERDQAIDMHRIFQRDLCKLRLSTARSYVNLITSSSGSLSSTGSASLKLDAKIHGLGPAFSLVLSIRNTSSKTLTELPIAITYNHDVYSVTPPLILLPVLVSGVDYTFNIGIQCIQGVGANEAIRVFVCSNKSCVPLISAIVNMPMCELEPED